MWCLLRLRAAIWVLEEGKEFLSRIRYECAVLYTRRMFVVQSESRNLKLVIQFGLCLRLNMKQVTFGALLSVTSAST